MIPKSGLRFSEKIMHKQNYACTHKANVAIARESDMQRTSWNVRLVTIGDTTPFGAFPQAVPKANKTNQSRQALAGLFSSIVASR